MDTQAKLDRRRFLSMAAIAVILAEFGGLNLAKAQSELDSVSTSRKSKPFPLAFGQTKQVKAGDLNIGYAENGPENGRPVILLHGWPYDKYFIVIAKH